MKLSFINNGDLCQSRGRDKEMMWIFSKIVLFLSKKRCKYCYSVIFLHMHMPRHKLFKIVSFLKRNSKRSFITDCSSLKTLTYLVYATQLVLDETHVTNHFFPTFINKPWHLTAILSPKIIWKNDSEAIGERERACQKMTRGPIQSRIRWPKATENETDRQTAKERNWEGGEGEKMKRTE